MHSSKEIINNVNNPEIGHKICSKCQFLSNRRWEPKKYLFDYITIATSRLCNLRCSFCDIVRRVGDYSTSSSRYIPCSPLLERMIENDYLSPYSTVNISGCEPVLFQEFDKLVELLAPNVAQLKIFSNGSIYSEALLNALNNSATNLVLSLDAADPKIYRKIKGKDLCDTAWENAAKYAAIGKERVFLKMIITEDNINDIKGFVERARQNNIISLYFDLDKGQTIASESEISREMFTKYAEAIAEFKLECLKNNINSSNAQAGCTKEIEMEANNLLEEKTKKCGIIVPTCKLKYQESSFSVGKSIEFTVKTSGYDMNCLQFKFFIKYENTDWQEMQAYSSQKTYCWVPDQPGCYSICAYIRFMDSQLPFSDYDQIEICIL